MSVTDFSGNPAHADLTWTADGKPRSRHFDDVYFSREDGLAETRYVFLEGNQLETRWKALAPGSTFQIAETGFGTGLNFLAAWDLWNRTAPADAQLEFLSVEAFPLTGSDLARAHESFEELTPLARQLQHHYPRCRHRGVHRLSLDLDRVRLTLLIGEATKAFEDCLDSSHPAHRRFRPGIDAWFLDGFAPAKNPDMWQPELFSLLQTMSAPDATLATFTAAGFVRRELSANGFAAEKRAGFGRKREMLTARLADSATLPPTTEFPPSPRRNGLPHAWDVASTREAPAADSPFTVIGAGLAGCHIARALAERGFRVQVVDAKAPGQGGSGNAQGVLYAKPSANGGVASDFNLAALQYAQRHYQPWFEARDQFGEPYGVRSGVLHVGLGEKDIERQEALINAWPDQELFEYADKDAASEYAGINVTGPALWFRDSGWLRPAALCAGLLEHPGISVMQNTVRELKRSDNEWQLIDDHQDIIARSAQIILACASGLKGITPQPASLPTQVVRGQVSAVPTKDVAGADRLKAALCADGYVTPPLGDRLNFGASFVPNDDDTRLRESEHLENLERLQRQFPGLGVGDIDPDDCTGRAALRCATPDRLPMVGPIARADAMGERFSLLSKNAEASVAEAGAFYPGLWVSAGYGSRGLAYIPLATQLLCWHLLGGPPPVSRALRRALHPSRFQIRNLIRNIRMPGVD